MIFHRNFGGNRKGIGTLFGMVFFLLITMIVFASLMIVLNQNTSLEKTISQTRQIDNDRAREQLTISPQGTTNLYTSISANSVTVNCVLNDTGNLPIQFIRLWVVDLKNSESGFLEISTAEGALEQGQAKNFVGTVSLSVSSPATDQFRFWFVTARGNQFTLGETIGGVASEADIYQSLSKVLGDFLPDYRSVQWAQINDNTGVVNSSWHVGWQLPTTETASQHGMMTVWKVDMTYYGNATLTLGPNTCLSWTPLNAVDRENDEPFLCYIVNFNVNTQTISDFPLSGIQIPSSPTGTKITLYFGAEDEFSTGPAPMNPIPRYYPSSKTPGFYQADQSKTFIGMEDEDEIAMGSSMNLNLYGKSPDTYAQAFPLYIVGTRTYTISIAPVNGNVGTSVTVTGTGFKHSSTITLSYDGATLVTSPTSITSSSSGAFTATFTVPPSTVGSHVVSAMDTDFNTAIAAFTVTPHIVINPTQGPNGTSVTLSGTGFSANSQVSIKFGSVTISITPQIATDASGSILNTIFSVPNLASGSQTVNATDANGVFDTATFTVVASSISINPINGIIGTTVTVTGSTFLPNLPLTVTYDGATVAMSTSTGSGAIPTGITFIITPSTFGSHAVRVTDGSGNYAQTTFSVTATISLNPQTGPVGTPVTVIGQGFGALKTITITFAGSAIATSPSPITTDGSGSFVSTFTIPTGSSTSSVAGAKTVVGSDSSSSPNSASATFTITPLMSLAPTSGPTGTVVTITGTGYGGSKTMTIKYGASTMTTSPTTVTTTTFGTFSCTFTVPASVVGLNTVTGTDSSSNADTETFAVIPNVTLNPTSGNVGSSVSVSGTGFGSNKGLTATFNGAAVSLSGTTSTGGTGSFAGAIFTVPISTAGVQTVVITDASSNSASATFTVNTVVQPITVTMSNSAPSATVTINGGYPSPATFIADGNPHSITMVGGSPFTLSFSNSGNTRNGFSVSSVFSSTSSSYSASTTLISGTAYEQVQNTFSVSGVSGSDSVALTGTYLGTGSFTIATLNSGNTWSTLAWSDYNRAITFPATTTNSGTNERWTIGNAFTTAALTAGGNTYSQTYAHQSKVTFDASNNVKADSSVNLAIINSTGHTLPFTTDWLNAGVDSLTYAFQSPIASTGSPSNTQYVWSSTSGLSQTLQSNSFTVNTAGTVTGTFTTQYKLTFAQSGLDNSATGNVVTVNGAAQTYGNLPFTTAWINSGSTVTYNYNNPVTSSTTGNQFRLNSVTGSTSPITVNSPATIIGNYVVQWQVSFTQTGIDSFAGSNTVLTVGATNYAYNALPSSVYIDSGTIFTWLSPVSGGSGKQFVQTGSSGSSPISATGTYSATYKTQWLVTFAQSGLSADATGTVVTVAGSAKTFSNLPFTVWVDASSGSVTYSYTATVTSVTGKQYIKTSTDASPVTGLSGPLTVTGAYKTQWQVSFTQTGIDSSAGSNTVLTVGATNYAYNALPTGVWLDSGTTFSWLTPVSGGTGKQFALTGSSGSSPISATGTYSATYKTVAIVKIGADTSANGAALTLSWSHTLVAGSNRMVVVCVGAEHSGITVSGVTYGGNAMTRAVTFETSSTGVYMLNQIWYILEGNMPTNGAKTVTITTTSIGGSMSEISGFCAEYTGVKQSAPEATNGVSQFSGNTIANSISPTANSWVISTAGAGDVGSWTSGSPQVQALNFSGTTSCYSVAELQGASGQTSLASTYAGTVNRLVRVCASFQAAP